MSRHVAFLRGSAYELIETFYIAEKTEYGIAQWDFDWLFISMELNGLHIAVRCPSTPCIFPYILVVTRMLVVGRYMNDDSSGYGEGRL